jgi:hypothetical protein
MYRLGTGGLPCPHQLCLGSNVEQKQREGIVREPGGSERNSGKPFFLTNLDWVLDVPANHGQCLLKQHVHGHNP